MTHGKEAHDRIDREIEQHDSDQKVLDGIIASEIYPKGTWIGVLYGEPVIVESTEDNFHERIGKKILKTVDAWLLHKLVLREF